MFSRLFYLFLLSFLSFPAISQNSHVFVDNEGIMRWSSNDSEVRGFGVNYTVPFAHAWRSAKKLGVDPLEAIDHDVYHMKRLGFDLYRVHVWDTEISDTLGNLLDNEHLHAFDYLLKKLTDYDFNYVLTPIAYWGGGWPEPDEETPGFSHKYGKDACLTNPDAIRAQENYLTQFMQHVNPYTGIAHKDDPHVIAVEVSNEPHHREAPEKVTAFVRRMVDAVKASGYAGPVFYNTSHGVHLMEDYFEAGIDGGTFQWYPTGLGYQRELPGNLLPNVDRYNMPFDDVFKENGSARLVYEFDAADVGRTYIYPAMARSFRTAGIQVATHFSYDPTFLAYANTEYNTHYMNIAYTPGKALALKLCSEVFHRVPMYKDYGTYPENTRFEGFTVDDASDLAMLNIEERYIYTNTTETPPVYTSALKQIAGCGSSPVVRYNGTGAYFLDKLSPGVWRLEVMPDALIIDNPYGRNSLDKTIAVIQWNTRNMRINLPDFGAGIKVLPLDSRNTFEPEVTGKHFSIRPGVYLCMRDGLSAEFRSSDPWEGATLGTFHAPETTVKKTHCVHDPVETAIAGTPLRITAQVISPEDVTDVICIYLTGQEATMVTMEKVGPFAYTTTISAEKLRHGFMDYYLLVHSGGKTMTFPSEKEGRPFDWDFYDRNPWRVRVLAKQQPIPLFHAQDDWDKLSRSWWSVDSRLVPTDHQHAAEYQVRIAKLHREDPENLNAPVIEDYSIRHYLNPKIGHLRDALSKKTNLVITARSLDSTPKPIQVALITSDGAAWGKVIILGTEMQEHTIPLDDLSRVKMVTMPRPYPTFLPYYFETGSEEPFRVENVEGLQISVGPGMPEEDIEGGHGIGIVDVWLD